MQRKTDCLEQSCGINSRSPRPVPGLALMPTPLKRRLRLARRGAWYGLAVLLVFLAVVIGVAGQLLPVAERHPERIAAWLSERAGRPVAFDRVQTHWTRRGPLLSLDGLRVGEGDSAVRIGEAEVLVSMYAGLLPGGSFTELRLRNLSLVLQRADDGAWSVQGLPGQATGGDPLETLEGLGELQLIDADLSVQAPSLDWNLKIPGIDLRLRVDGRRVRAGALARAQGGVEPLRISFEFDRSTGDGRGYFEASQADLSQWTPILRFAGVQVTGGQGQARAWVELSHRRVVMLTSELQLQQVVLDGQPLSTGAAPMTASFEMVEASARWRALDEGWRLDVPSLRIGAKRAPHRLDGLTVSGGSQWGMLADKVEAQPLLQVLALSDRVPVGTRRWLAQARPTGELAEALLTGDSSGLLRAQGAVKSLGFAAAGASIGLSGLSGRLIGDAEGFSFEADPAAAVRVDWPAAFDIDHAFHARGRVSGWRDGAGWRIGTPALHILGDELKASVRGGVWFQGDGTRPRLDLAMQVEQIPLVEAKHFLVRHRMPTLAVDWLDRALLGGELQDTRALISGDLDEWPFRDERGRFEASARISQGRFKFHPQWPALEQAAVDVRWLGNGLVVNGRGEIAGVGVDRVEAVIADFAQADLSISAEGAADAGKLLALVRQSPLNDAHAETLRNITASGAAHATFELLQPLRSERAARKKMSGSIQFQDAQLSEQRWNLDFDHVRGTLEYGLGGLRAERLAVRMEGHPGLLSLRAGAMTRDRLQAFEAGLSTSLSAAELLERAPVMAWLEPYIEGRSLWSIGVSVPKGQSGSAASRLHLQSDLVGTTLKLPAPLDKPAGRALLASVQTALPMDRGQIEVSLGQLLSLRAGSGGSRKGMRVKLGGAVQQPVPDSGLVVEGNAASLDALGWISVTRSIAEDGNPASAGPGAGAGAALALRSVDVTSQNLLLLGTRFPDTRLRAAPVDQALAVTVDGNALSGSLRVPKASGAAITGTFQRVHWLRQASAGTTPPKTGSLVQTADPAAVPPLALDIDDLRFGDAKLGSATLRTQPLPAGLRVTTLALRSPGQEIDVTGDWVGRGRAAKTNMSTRIASQDLGKLLDQLGFKDHLRGGKGQVQFDARWAGGPSAFALGAIDGRLSIDARDGQLLELEPGAGRVLGLLSITQLPRRVLLDFRDFFSKGFAFNQIEGGVDIADGKASTDDMAIDGPAARIKIRGSTDLAAQQFNQTIEVQPSSGNLLAVVGAVAGGPLGAAVGAAANAVLRKPLGELGAKTYRVTGPWKDPEVELIREASRIQAPARVPVDGPG